MSNLDAFLTMITTSELRQEVIDGSDDGYDVLVGSTPKNIMTFKSYADHPRIYNSLLKSTAAGAYQILQHNFDYYKKMLNLPDFGPDSQDAIATQMIKECHALDLIASGHIAICIQKCCSRWASLPGNGYGQHQNELADLIEIYKGAGGELS